jgi:hypothetical protein
VLEHALALAGVLGAGWPGYVKSIAMLLLGGTLWLSRPARSTTLVVDSASQWALPEEALHGLRLLPGSQFTRAWALLRFVGPGATRRDLPVWSDTLSREDWRRLHVRLREHRFPGDQRNLGRRRRGSGAELDERRAHR